jgi:hypothetical protein
MVDTDQAAGAGHVVDDKHRIAWNILAHMACHDARVDVVAAAGGEGDDDPNCLALEKQSLGQRRWFEIESIGRIQPIENEYFSWLSFSHDIN